MPQVRTRPGLPTGESLQAGRGGVNARVGLGGSEAVSWAAGDKDRPVRASACPRVLWALASQAGEGEGRTQESGQGEDTGPTRPGHWAQGGGRQMFYSRRCRAIHHRQAAQPRHLHHPATSDYFGLGFGLASSVIQAPLHAWGGGTHPGSR